MEKKHQQNFCVCQSTPFVVSRLVVNFMSLACVMIFVCNAVVKHLEKCLVKSFSLSFHISHDYIPTFHKKMSPSSHKLLFSTLINDISNGPFT